MTNLSQAKLRSLLNYDKNTGDFTWIKSPTNSIKAGAVAGSAMKDGYVRIGICEQDYLAHRLVFLYEFGEMPADQVDHINKTKDDNRLVNLRQCNNSENQANIIISCNNTSGYKGVYLHKANNKWRARIKSEHIGLFSSKDDAAEAYNKKAAEYFGEYAHLNKITGKMRKQCQTG